MTIRPTIPASRPSTSLDAVRPPARRLWTLDELERMDQAGILHPEERVELIAGEVLHLSPKGISHEVVRTELTLNWARRLPQDVKFAGETPLRLDAHNAPEPDIMLFPAALQVHQVRGDNVLLIVEISDTSLPWDLKTKAQMYAQFGVREYWVISAKTHETTVHRTPSAAGYGQVHAYVASDLLTPFLVPTLAVRITDLSIGAV